MKMNIHELHAQFCQEAEVIKNYRPSTIGYYERSFKQFLRFAGSEWLEEITTEKLRQFLYDGRIQRGWTADTFLCHYKSLRAFLKWCVNRKYISENPILSIEKPKLEKKLPKRITKEEAFKLLEHTFNRKCFYTFERYRNTGLFAVMLYAGLRASEVLNLKMHDVDLDNNVIHVNQGKGGKDRVVPICLSLRRYLKAYTKERKRLNRKCTNFFLSSNGDMPFTYGGLQKMTSVIKERNQDQILSS